MKIITFDLVGKFAHFRKYFSNSTALSYTIPPRTVIIGIIAAIMGYEKDSYYECLSRQKLKIAVGVKSRIKKSIHRVNNLMIKSRSLGDFMGERHHTQSPIEIITPEDLKTGEIIYRIFLLSDDIEFRDTIINRLTKKDTVYNISLGVAQFSASTNNLLVFNDDEIEEIICKNESVSFNSVVCSSNVVKITFEIDETWKYNFVEEDLIPIDFLNKNRELSALNRLLYTTNDLPFKVNFTGCYYKLIKSGLLKNIQFL